MKRYIIVTGGVVSGIGKGIATASIGVLLKSIGLKLDAAKFDPYLNTDPGTMSPFEHGEVYVLDDGSETDLDLGHYERFLDTNLTKSSSINSGRIYQNIINKERHGDFLGKTVQLIPHVTQYIQELFESGPTADVKLIEIGGSTGDIEQEIFLESVRQFKQKHKENLMHIHLGFVPYLACSHEFKTKPFQNSLRELLKAGIQPDVLIARYEPRKGKHVTENTIQKLALFSNLPQHNIIAVPDLNSIYDVPELLSQTSMPTILNSFLKREESFEIPSFYTTTERVTNIGSKINIGLITKYTRLTDAYLSVIESVHIAAQRHGATADVVFIDAEKLETNDEQTWELLKSMSGIIVPGGFGKRGMEGKIKAISYAEDMKIPFLGICLGMQLAVVHAARKTIPHAVSREMIEDLTTKEQAKHVSVIDYLPDQTPGLAKGGTMRLGGYDCTISPGTYAADIFKRDEIRERHRHRLEVQSQYISHFESSGLKASGFHTLPNAEKLVEIVELPKQVHPFFVGIQSHPEFLSRPGNPHPLFNTFIKKSLS